ncbi:unnamed protein product [Closterium sp. NIES-54]
MRTRFPASPCRATVPPPSSPSGGGSSRCRVAPPSGWHAQPPPPPGSPRQPPAPARPPTPLRRPTSMTPPRRLGSCRWSCRRPSSMTSFSTSASPCAASHLDVDEGWSIYRGLPLCRPRRCHRDRDTRRKGGRDRGRSNTPAIDHHLHGPCPASTSFRRRSPSTAHLRSASCAALAADSASSVQRSLPVEGAPWAVRPPASPRLEGCS